MKTQISRQHANAVAVQPQTTFHKEDRMKNQCFATMSLLKKSLLAVVIMVCAIMPVAASASSTFNPTDGGLILANTTPDIDTFLVSQFVGFFPTSQPLSYQATNINSAGFNNSLTGNYGGTNLAVNYTGTVVQANPFIVEWSGTGAYGSSPIITGGFASFQYMGGPGVFEENYGESFTVGANTASLSLLINGVNTNGVYTLLSSSGTFGINGVEFPLVNNFGLTLDGVSADKIYPGSTSFWHYVQYNGSVGTNEDYANYGTWTVGPNQTVPIEQARVSAYVAPEPSSMMLFSSGILGIAGILRRKLMG
jgi:hypothetical protein